MAVTLEILQEELRQPSGVDDSRLSRLLSVAQTIVNAYVTDSLECPEALKDEGVILMVGYVYDSPPAYVGSGYANSFRNSGAESILSRYHIEGSALIGSSAEPKR